ncbi:hypothetical protein CF335_g8248, partial [Tilletia laevis]
LSFHAPVEIGSMLSLTARVDYSEIMGMKSEGSGEDVDGDEDGVKEAVAAVSVVAEIHHLTTSLYRLRKNGVPSAAPKSDVSRAKAVRSRR